MDDISSNSREKNRLGNKVEDELNPEIVELVIYMAAWLEFSLWLPNIRIKPRELK